MPFSQLKSALAKGELKVKDVLAAFQYQAAMQDREFNFVCEPIYEAEVGILFREVVPS